MHAGVAFGRFGSGAWREKLLRVARLYRLVVLGLVIVLVVLFMPKGVGGVLRDRLDKWKRGLA